jgi:hypothetical protein
MTRHLGIQLSSRPELKTPILGLYDADDAGIKIEQIEEMQSALKVAGKHAGLGKFLLW